MSHKGLISVEPKRLDLVAGGKRRLGSVPLTDGHWAPYLPPPKDQRTFNGTVEPNDCVSHAILKAVQILQTQEFGQHNDYSERFLAKMTGTDKTMGNDPNVVAQFLKNKGCVLETDWPQNLVTTLAEFYAPIPIPVQTLALDFPDEFDYGHEWVLDTSAYSLMDALKYSPITVGVYAWLKNPTIGLYNNPGNLKPEHYVVIYDFVENDHWLAYDTYAEEIKSLEWDFPFSMIKKHTLHRQIIDETAWGQFKAFIRKLLNVWPLPTGF